MTPRDGTRLALALALMLLAWGAGWLYEQTLMKAWMLAAGSQP